MPPRFRFLWFLVSSLASGSAVAADAGDGLAVGAVMGEAFGFAVYPIPSRGVEARYVLSNDSALGLSYAAGSLDQLLATYTAALFVARYEYSIGSLTHINGGLGWRSLSQAYSSDAIGGTLSALDRRQSLVIEASFGSHLAIGPILINADWVGITVPVVKLGSHTDIPDGIDADVRAVNAAAFDRVASGAAQEFLRVSAGVTF